MSVLATARCWNSKFGLIRYLYEGFNTFLSALKGGVLNPSTRININARLKDKQAMYWKNHDTIDTDLTDEEADTSPGWFFDYPLCGILVYISMPWDLKEFMGSGIFVNIVFLSVPDKNSAVFFYFLKQFLSFHAGTCSFPVLRMDARCIFSSCFIS